MTTGRANTPAPSFSCLDGGADADAVAACEGPARVASPVTDPTPPADDPSPAELPERAFLSSPALPTESGVPERADIVAPREAHPTHISNRNVDNTTHAAIDRNVRTAARCDRATSRARQRAPTSTARMSASGSWRNPSGLRRAPLRDQRSLDAADSHHRRAFVKRDFSHFARADASRETRGRRSEAARERRRVTLQS